jgi:hypothetical protein
MFQCPSCLKVRYEKNNHGFWGEWHALMRPAVLLYAETVICEDCASFNITLDFATTTNRAFGVPSHPAQTEQGVAYG